MTPTEQFDFYAADESATAALGTAIATALPPNSVVALLGTLGAGKTRLVQAIATALGADPRLVVSPTFTLIQEYRGKTPICHIDAYRLGSPEEVWELGLEEYFSAGGVTLVEWGDRIRGFLPAQRLEICISDRGPTQRHFEVKALGDQYQPVLDALRGWAPRP